MSFSLCVAALRPFFNCLHYSTFCNFLSAFQGFIQFFFINFPFPHHIVNPFAVMSVGVVYFDGAILHAVDGVGVGDEGQVDMADGAGKTDAGAKAMQGNHPGADAVIDKAVTEPQEGAGADEGGPGGQLQGDVHAFAAVVEALLGNAFGVLADEFQGELDEEGHILAVELEDFGEHAPDALPGSEQADNRVQHEENSKEAMRILQGFRTEHVVEEPEGIGIEGQSRQKQHEEADGVDPMQIHEAFRMAFDVFLVDEHHLSPFLRIAVRAVSPNTPAIAPTLASCPTGRTKSFQMLMEDGVAGFSGRP